MRSLNVVITIFASSNIIFNGVSLVKAESATDQVQQNKQSIDQRIDAIKQEIRSMHLRQAYNYCNDLVRQGQITTRPALDNCYQQVYLQLENPPTPVRPRPQIRDNPDAAAFFCFGYKHWSYSIHECIDD
jgi:hypothetical protein